MDNMEQELQKFNSMSSNKVDYSLGLGTKCLQNGEEIIWGNLLTGEWFKMPKISMEFFIACTEAPTSHCIKVFSKKTGISTELFSNLLKFAYMKGFLENKDMFNSSIEGIEFINTSHDTPQKVEIRENYSVQKINFCLKAKQDVSAKLITYEQWKGFFEKIKKKPINKVSIFLWEDNEGEKIKHFISLLKQYIDLLDINVIVRNYVNLQDVMLKLTECLSADTDVVIIRIETEKISNIKSLEQYKKQIISILQPSGIKVIFKLGIQLIGDEELLTYIKNEEELELYSLLNTCSYCVSHQIADKLYPERMIENWFKLIQQYSIIANKYVNYSGADSYFYRLKLSCGAGRSTIAISDDGSVYPCPALMADKLRIGSIVNDEISELEIKSNKLLANTSVENRKDCQNCFSAYFCGGGCLARAYHAFGNMDSADPFCSFYKKGPGLIPWCFDNELPLQDNLQCLINKTYSIRCTNNEDK